jgi:hypothetical protein
VLANRPALQAAGLILWKDVRNYVVLLQYTMREQRRQSHMLLFQARRDGKLTCTETAKVPPDGDKFLMLSRSGGEVRGVFGPDGTRWFTPENLSAKFPDAAKVGVTAWNLTTAPYDVELTDFTVSYPLPTDAFGPGMLMFGPRNTANPYPAAPGTVISPTGTADVDRSGRWDLYALSEMMTQTPILVVAGAVLACLLALWVGLRKRAPRTVAEPKTGPPPFSTAATPEVVPPILQEIQEERNAVVNQPEPGPDTRPEGT